MKTKTGNKLVGVFFAVVLAIAGYMIYQSFQADAFCQDKGHDTGRFKGDGGPHYSCIDFTKYRIKDGKN